MDNIRVSDKGLILNIRILPNSSKNQVIVENDTIKIKVTAQPIENKANKALIEYLSKLLKVPKTSISILKGETSKDKTLLVAVTDKEKQQIIMNMLIDGQALVK